LRCAGLRAGRPSNSRDHWHRLANDLQRRCIEPHRAEIAKMMTRLSHRGRGIATALMRRAEEIAVKRKRTLLVLDTATDGGASGLYEKLGFSLAGEIPDYAFKPHGGLSGALFYWKRIGS